MDASALLKEITDYCRRAGMAESTFGKLAVNDGKFVSRLRDGGRITGPTLDRVRGYIGSNPPRGGGDVRFVERPQPAPAVPQPVRTSAETGFRFYNNRQKYLQFVHTCSEKWIIGDRVAMELSSLH